MYYSLFAFPHFYNVLEKNELVFFVLTDTDRHRLTRVRSACPCLSVPVRVCPHEIQKKIGRKKTLDFIEIYL